MHRTLTAIAATALWMTAAQADPFSDAVVAKYQEMGFDFVEVQNGINQVKVEAIRGADKIEVIYDRETGRILKQEQERATAREMARAGIQVRDRDRDFVRAGAGGSGIELSAAAEDVIADLRAEGFDYFEVKNGPTQVKIEAIRGGDKVELVIDRESGAVLKREIESAGDDAGRSGMDISARDKDFLGGGSSDDDDDDDHDNSGSGSHDDDDDDDDDDHDNSGSGSGDDDDDDDDDNSGSGDDD